MRRGSRLHRRLGKRVGQPAPAQVTLFDEGGCDHAHRKTLPPIVHDDCVDVDEVCTDCGQVLATVSTRKP